MKTEYYIKVIIVHKRGQAKEHQHAVSFDRESDTFRITKNGHDIHEGPMELIDIMVMLHEYYSRRDGSRMGRTEEIDGEENVEEREAH